MAKFINKGKLIDTDTISNRLALVMKQRKLSDYNVAQMINKSRVMVTHMRTGKRDFTIDTAVEICKALDVDFIWFVTGIK